MNALHPPLAAQGAETQEAGALDPWPDTAGTLRLLCRLSGGYGAILLLLGVLWATPLGAEACSSGLAGVMAGAVLLALAGLLADRDGWDARRERARAFVERERNWSSNIGRYEPVYQRLIDAARRKTRWSVSPARAS